MAASATLARSRPRVSTGYRRILVPLVDNPESEQAIDVACRLATERHGSIVAAAVIEIPPSLPLDAHMDEEEAEAHRVLARAQAVGESYGVDVSPCVVRAREAATAIVERARSSGAEIVVIGGARRRRRGMRTPVFRHTVQEVLKKAPSRVLVVAGRG